MRLFLYSYVTRICTEDCTGLFSLAQLRAIVALTLLKKEGSVRDERGLSQKRRILEVTTPPSSTTSMGVRNEPRGRNQLPYTRCGCSAFHLHVPLRDNNYQHTSK